MNHFICVEFEVSARKIKVQISNRPLPMHNGKLKRMGPRDLDFIVVCTKETMESLKTILGEHEDYKAEGNGSQ